MGTPTVRRKHRDSSSDESVRDYGSPSPDTQRPSGKQQIRHRASVACASCRERRIRCVVPPGQTECTQCSRTGTECIIKNDDERRRPISKAYMSSLSNRIALLEDMLKEKGVAPPPAVHPPKTRQEALKQQEEQQQTQTSSSEEPPSLRHDSAERHPPTPPSSVEEDHESNKRKREDSVASLGHAPSQLCMIEPSLLDFEPKHDANVRRLLCPRGRLTFDQSAGRQRFFGPTANIHVYAETSSQFDSRDPPEQTRRADRVIRNMGSSTHDYLMRCFWDHFNASHQIVDQATFEADRVSQDPKFYSAFLHITMLAAGFRFADKTREDVKRLSLGSWESSLHREAKSMLDIELERPGEIPSVQALLILADLECGVGRDTQGWMYSGMANRLASDVGLHVNHGDAISETEKRVRRQTMAACVMLDRQLAMFLGRPSGIKIQDIGIDLTPKEFSSVSMSNSMFGLPDFNSKPTNLDDAAVHHQLMELMGLASNITDSFNLSLNPADPSGIHGAEGARYLTSIAIDRQLQNWYRCLPAHLAWNPNNVKNAPLSFFLLHQQFHICMILVHRPWARYGPSADLTSTAFSTSAPFPYATSTTTPSLPEDIDSKTALARSNCTQHAIRIARIFWQHRQRYDGKKTPLLAIQHAGVAALALMGALAHQSKDLDHQSNLRYLQVLSSAIYDMSQTYHPAARMYHLLKSMLVDIRKEMVASRANMETDFMLRHFRQHSVSYVPGAYGPYTASAPTGLPVIQEETAVKRRRLSERRPSELELNSQSLFGGFRYPSPPGTGAKEKEVAIAEEDEQEQEQEFNFDFGFLEGLTEAVAAEIVPEPESAQQQQQQQPQQQEAQPEKAEDVVVVGQTEKEKKGDEVEMTLEEWLSEPRVMTPVALQQGEAEKKDQRQEIPQPMPQDMGWVEGEGDCGLGELVKSVEAETKREKSPVRNLDLDFLSL
ncbi:hypothetical protein OQA88_3030 [Cercophora sp. LCS_1]